MGLDVEDRLRQLVGQIEVTAGYKEHWIKLTREIVNELQQRRVQCVDKFVHRLERCTKGKDIREYWDILMEGRFAIILARNNFSDIYIEYIDKGPDLKANWNRNTVYFEITRKRAIEDEWAEQVEDPKLPSNKTGNTIGKIKSKLKQLKPGEINIVVFWSSTVAVLVPEMKEAFKEIDNDPEQYKDLSGVLFTGDGGISIPTLEQFYLFKNDKASKPLGPRLAKRLEYLREFDLKQFQREHEGILARFKFKKQQAN